MISIGSRVKLYIGGWVIGALLILGLNALLLASIHDPILVGAPDQIRVCREKWNYLNRIISAKRKKSPTLIVLKRFYRKNTSLEEQEQGADKREEKVLLPVLSGIIRCIDMDGKKSCLALMEGRVYREKESCKGFYVKKISPHGVIVSRSGKDWFLELPDIYYSVERCDFSAPETSNDSSKRDAAKAPSTPDHTGVGNMPVLPVKPEPSSSTEGYERR